jgi:hypothetical protein
METVSRPLLAIWLTVLLSTFADLAAGVERRFCSDDAENVLILLDVTTPYDDADKTTLVDGISRIYEGLPDGARLSIRTIEDQPTASHRLVDLCIPYCPSEGFLKDLLSKCTQGVVISERKHQRQQISKALYGTTRERAELPHSAIARTIATVAPEEFVPGRQNKIYIFSDMIENSDYLSGADFWRKPNVEILEKMSADHVVPDFSGATATIFGVGRGGGVGRTPLPQERLIKLQDFWALYFRATGATATLKQNLGITD